VGRLYPSLRRSFCLQASEKFVTQRISIFIGT
jgi:hypothetical protein